jgi:phosphomannomutase/phosphoglucomutase
VGIFKACDIRGAFGTELTEAVAYRLGQAVGTRLHPQTVAVAGDVRLSTPALKAALIDGLMSTGCQVFDVGTLPTPALSFAATRLRTAGSVMVTASHNPPGDNGFKLTFGGRPPDEATLAALEREMAAGAFAHGHGRVRKVDALSAYQVFLGRRFAPGGRLPVVVDCGNGCAGLAAPQVLAGLGYQVETLFAEPDGRFPNRPPNPALAPNLAALRQRVVATGAALGLAYDGDGDRVAFVDERGQVAETDRVALLLAQRILARRRGEVIYDIKCSSALPEGVRGAGGIPVMARSGHAFIKTALLERGAVFGAETSGHLFFPETAGDDALYASCFLLEILETEGRSLAELLEEVPRYPITPDIRLPCPANEAGLILEKVAEAFEGYPVLRLDGVRIDFADGWALARRSVTEPLITLRFEARTGRRLAEIQRLVRERVPALAAIWPGN